MEKQMEHFREPEAVADTYDQSLSWRIEMSRRRREGQVLLRAQDLPRTSRGV